MNTISLETLWTPASEDRPSVYELSLRNGASEALVDFALGFSGPAAGIDPHAEIDGGTLRSRLSNWSLIAPPDGYVLPPGGTWRVAIRSLTHPLRHWSDGARGAYLAFADGRMLPIVTTPPNVVGEDGALLTGAARFLLPEAPPVELSIIPWPNHLAVDGARATPSGLSLKPMSTEEQRVVAAFTEMVRELFPDEGLVHPTDNGGMPVTFSSKPLGPEAYEIAFNPTGAIVSAASQAGHLYGLVTLGQILRGALQHPGKLVVPASGTIADSPALAWRGAHLDVARQFYSSGEISRLLKLLAWNKMNRFHWHLSDDEAWRVEIDAYPALTSVGAWRGHGLPLPPFLGSGPSRAGGYYSKAEIREIVALGQTLGIEIVPEIDIPGHCYAALEALPELRDPGETHGGESVQGFLDNCLNPAHEPVYRFIETVVDELLELFPSRIFHLGADEVPLSAWSGSPKALELLERLAGKEAADRHRALADSITSHEFADQIGGSGTAILQAQFIGRVHRYIASKGATTGGWEEAAHGDILDRRTSYLVGWRDIEISAALAGEGHDIVVSPGQRYYLDMANGPGWSEPGAGWAGWSGPEETYRFEPRDGWSEMQLQHLLGVQTCIWSEPMADRAIFDRLVFPRISAVAETGWTAPGNKSWKRFAALCGLMPIMYGHWA
ncbi:MAG: beta-N-acetylhexosaminidase [Devosia sp.]